MQSLLLQYGPPADSMEACDGGGQRWSVWCNYGDHIDTDIQHEVIATINTAAAFIEVKRSNEQLLCLREFGYMDEIIYFAAISLRGIQDIVQSPLKRVRVTSIEDVNALGTGMIHDVTQVMKAAVGES